MQDYKSAKEIKSALEKRVSEHSSALKKFPTNSMGMVHESVRNTPEFKKAKQDYHSSFSELQKVNQVFTKKFKKEYIAEREQTRKEHEQKNWKQG